MNFNFELEEDILLEIQEALMDLVIKNPDEKIPMFMNSYCRGDSREICEKYELKFYNDWVAAVNYTKNLFGVPLDETGFIVYFLRRHIPKYPIFLKILDLNSIEANIYLEKRSPYIFIENTHGFSSDDFERENPNYVETVYEDLLDLYLKFNKIEDTNIKKKIIKDVEFNLKSENLHYDVNGEYILEIMDDLYDYAVAHPDEYIKRFTYVPKSLEVKLGDLYRYGEHSKAYSRITRCLRIQDDYRINIESQYERNYLFIKKNPQWRELYYYNWEECQNKKR